MSQYKFINDLGREVIYGLDKPTGGYFVNEFFTDEEMEKKADDEDIVFSISAATLTDTLITLNSKYKYIVNGETIRKLINDFVSSPEPSPLQVNVSIMFGVNLSESLGNVEKDLRNY